jgi:hypothetical protein
LAVVVLEADFSANACLSSAANRFDLVALSVSMEMGVIALRDKWCDYKTLTSFCVRQGGHTGPHEMQDKFFAIHDHLGDRSMYDPKCFDLARYFLEGQEYTPDEAVSLAQEIQDSIERWFEPRQDRSKEVTP